MGENGIKGFFGIAEPVSGMLTTANPRRIKAAHRRRRKVASGQSVQRYYDPGIPRFLSVDPVTAYGNPVGSFNRYWHANGNPYRFKGPDGRKCVTVDGKESCTFDEFKDKDGNTISREKALSGGNWLTKAGIDRGSRILRAEAGMTSKYSAAKALAAKNGEVTIKGNSGLGIPDQKVSGASIVGHMETIRTIANDSSKPGNPASVASTQVARSTGYVPGTPINFWRDGSSGSVEQVLDTKFFIRSILELDYQMAAGQMAVSILTIKRHLMRLPMIFTKCNRVGDVPRRYSLSIAVWFLLLAASCTTAPEPIGVEPSSFGNRLGLPNCQVSVPLSSTEAVELGRRWEIYPNPENDPEWIRMNSMKRPGDELRLISCTVGNPYYYALIRDNKVIFKYLLPVLD